MSKRRRPPAIRRAALAALVLASACAVREAPPIEEVEWQRELEANAAALDRLRTSPGGPLSWTGLWPLPEGSTTLGSGSDAAIRIEDAGVPALAATFVHAGADVLVEPPAGRPLQLADGTRIDGPLKLEDDLSSRPTVLAFGPLQLKVHAEPGTARRWIRALRTDAPAIAAYRRPERFTASRDFRVAARLRPSATGQPIALEDVTGGTQEFVLAGALEAKIQGQSVSLLAFKRPARDSLFVVFRDATAGTETYEAARYVYVPPADPKGWTVLDFNKAHNPPCAFTPHSTCVLPPKQNRLTIPIAAGEQRPATTPSR